MAAHMLEWLNNIDQGRSSRGLPEVQKPLKNPVFVYTLPCKTSNSHKDMIPQLLHRGANPLKGGMNCAPADWPCV